MEKEKEPNYHHGQEKEPKAKFITMEKKRAKGQIKLSTSSLCARLRFIQLPVVILMNFVNCPLCVLQINPPFPPHMLWTDSFFVDKVTVSE